MADLLAAVVADGATVGFLAPLHPGRAPRPGGGSGRTPWPPDGSPYGWRGGTGGRHRLADAELLYRSAGWERAGAIPDYAADPAGVPRPTTLYYKRVGTG